MLCQGDNSHLIDTADTSVNGVDTAGFIRMPATQVSQVKIRFLSPLVDSAAHNVILLAVVFSLVNDKGYTESRVCPAFVKAIMMPKDPQPGGTIFGPFAGPSIQIWPPQDKSIICRKSPIKL
jgi:hypothetical protein